LDRRSNRDQGQPHKEAEDRPQGCGISVEVDAGKMQIDRRYYAEPDYTQPQCQGKRQIAYYALGLVSHDTSSLSAAWDLMHEISADEVDLPAVGIEGQAILSPANQPQRVAGHIGEWHGAH